MSWGVHKSGVGISESVLGRMRHEAHERRLRTLEARSARAEDIAERARAKLLRGQPVTRQEAAAFLGVSQKKLQRMEAAGTLVRCPGFGTVVLYAARDILRLASANGKER